MFWGLILKANRKYTQTIKKSFHLSHAALDITSSSGGHVQVVLTSDKNDYILCTLKKDSVEQVPLDLNFEEGEEISFTSQGQGNVHLTGYLVIDDLDQLDEEDDDDQDEQLMLASKKKKVEKATIQKGEEDSDDDDDDDEGLEEDSSDEEEDDSEEESEEEDAQEPVSNKRKLEKPKQNGIDKQAPNKKVKKEQTVTEPPTKGEKTLPGGIKIEDIRVGQGPEAKPGKKVQVYYEGRLKSNNKVFDSTKNGPGFKFGLGKGEVIKAWDIGVAGMKVGGKRKIICPPHMAYGSKGSPPVIPPNSTLVFEVELKGVN